MKNIFFINPAAGKGAMQKRLLTLIKDHFERSGGDYEIYTTRFAGDAEQTARKYAESGEKMRVFACGGEGTCYEVVNGIYGFENVEMGVIPCGSANDFLKVFENTEIFRDIAAQTEGEVIKIDLIRAGDRYCINGCSVGMDAMVASDMKMFKKLPLVTGPLAYKLAVVKNFFKIKLGVKFELFLDDEPQGLKDCLFAVVANAPFYGGGYKGAPNAVPNDSELDFTLVDTITHIKALHFLPKYERGEFADLDYCHLKRCKKMSFSAGKSIPVNLDGEIAIAEKMDFEVVVGVLKFIIPKGLQLPKSLESQNLLKNI